MDKQLPSNSLDNWSEFIKTLPKLDFNSDWITRTEVKGTTLRGFRTGFRRHANGIGKGRHGKNRYTWGKGIVGVKANTTWQSSLRRFKRTRHVAEANKRKRKQLDPMRKVRQQSRRRPKHDDEAMPMQVDLPPGDGQ